MLRRRIGGGLRGIGGLMKGSGRGAPWNHGLQFVDDSGHLPLGSTFSLTTPSEAGFGASGQWS